MKSILENGLLEEYNMICLTLYLKVKKQDDMVTLCPQEIGNLVLML